MTHCWLWFSLMEKGAGVCSLSILDTLTHNWLHCLFYAYLLLPLVLPTLQRIQQSDHSCPAHGHKVARAALVSSADFTDWCMVTSSSEKIVVSDRLDDLAPLARLPLPMGGASQRKGQAPYDQQYKKHYWMQVPPVRGPCVLSNEN